MEQNDLRHGYCKQHSRSCMTAENVQTDEAHKYKLPSYTVQVSD